MRASLSGAGAQGCERRRNCGQYVASELAGCEADAKDVGRTLPVSGHFTPDEREVIGLMNGAYARGVQALRDGANMDEVVRVCSR